jgi:hypothetical protein
MPFGHNTKSCYLRKEIGYCIILLKGQFAVHHPHSECKFEERRTRISNGLFQVVPYRNEINLFLYKYIGLKAGTGMRDKISYKL